MPERVKAVTKITEHAIGGPILWNGIIGEPMPGQVRAASFVAREPIEITTKVWDKTHAEADALYDLIVNTIDFDRVLITAIGMHYKRQAEDEGHLDHIVGPVCAECVRDSLLTKER